MFLTPAPGFLVWMCTAIDVWAAGIIMASMLTKRYPLLKPLKTDHSDLAMLVQIIELLGLPMVKAAARAIGTYAWSHCVWLLVLFSCALWLCGSVSLWHWMM